MSTNSANLLDSPRHSKEEIAELRVYEAMSQAVITSLQDFLQPFQSTPDSTYVFKAMTREDFFPRFYCLANKMADDCSQRLVKIIHSSSRIAQVRQTAPPALAKRIREAAFKTLDAVLVSYAGVTQKVEVIYRNIKKIRDELEKVKANGGPGKRGGADSTAETGSATVEHWATEEQLGRQEASLFKARSQAFTKIVQYLKYLNELPGALLSYACDKCYAGEINYPLELDQVASIQAEIRAKLANAMETIARVGAVAKQELEQEQASYLANVELAQVQQALEKVWEQKVEAKLKAEQQFRKRITIAVICLLSLGIALSCFLFTR